ncbi:hypothetical protein AVEN_120325-1 [Araneus ventricosus]|uniref:Uncharacterized protein n=1 Tax=Araneus ventricosus TaxID=182803 RepID=A0A4Y2MKM4_ARAVE|nr:hypothetical protein AVEN_120325-1 [Araneus ventricosus]
MKVKNHENNLIAAQLFSLTYTQLPKGLLPLNHPMADHFWISTLCNWRGGIPLHSLTYSLGQSFTITPCHGNPSTDCHSDFCCEPHTPRLHHTHIPASASFMNDNPNGVK